MPKTHVERKITIDAPKDKVYEVVSNLSHWNAWSPWLVMDADARFSVSDDNKYYEWEGDRVGSGTMKITAEKENENVEYDLYFLKPWKSYARVEFALNDIDGKTEVSWIMDSSLPFFMFFMKKMMEGFIGMDFDRGLRMLKEYIEDGEIQTKLEFLGEKKFDGIKYVGIRRTISMDQLGIQMPVDFGKIEEFIKSNESKIDGIIFSQYHKWDIANNRVEYTSGVAVKENVENIPAGFIKGEIPATNIYTLRHVGKYEHLGNAWSTLNAMYRNKEFKHSKKVHPFEIYVNNPHEVPAGELITDVNFAVK